MDGVLRQDAGELFVVLERVGLLPGCRSACVQSAQVAPGGSTILFSSARAYFMSLTIGMCGFLILLISDGSMSMWTILPCLANSRDLAGHAIVEAHAEGQQQVGLVDGIVGIHAAVHAQHVQRQRIVAGEARPGPSASWSRECRFCATSSRSSSLALGWR